MQRPVRLNRVPEKVPGSRDARFNRVSEQVPEKVSGKVGKVWETLVQGQVRFYRVPEKVPEGLGGFGAEAAQGSTGFRSRPGRL